VSALRELTAPWRKPGKTLSGKRNDFSRSEGHSNSSAKDEVELPGGNQETPSSVSLARPHKVGMLGHGTRSWTLPFGQVFSSVLRSSLKIVPELFSSWKLRNDT